MDQAARVIVYEECLGVWVAERGCVLSVRADERKRRAEALKKLYHAISLVGRDYGMLGPLSSGHIVCASCTEDVEASHTRWRSTFWEQLSRIFSLAQSWGGV